MRSRLAIAWAIALFVATALVVAACGGNDNEKQTTTAAKKPSGTVTLWIMNNGPQPVPDMEKTLQPFTQKTGIKVKVELVGWDVQFDRIRNAAVSGEGPDVTQAGTTQVPFFAALGGFEDLNSRVKDIGGQAAYPEGVWNTTKIAGQDGVFAAPWFTEARAIYYRKDVLEKAGVDPATAFTNWDNFRATLQAIKDKVPKRRRREHPAVRPARQEGVRPRPPRDAVRVGRRWRRALGRPQDLDDQQPAGPAGRGVLRRPAEGRADGQEPARA